MLFVIAESSSAPNAEERDLASDMFASVASSLKVMSVVLEGAGFAAALKRSVFTFATSRLLGKIPTKTFGDLGQASDYLATKGADVGIGSPTSAALTTFVRSVHKHVAR